jgi:hypothetical protein
LETPSLLILVVFGSATSETTLQKVGVAMNGRYGPGRGELFGSLDDEDGFVVDQGFFAVLAKAVVLPNGILHQSVADVFGGLMLVFAEDQFELLACLRITAVIDAVGVENEDVTGVHERNFADVCGSELALAQIQSVILIVVGVVGGQLQAKGEKLCHVAFVDLQQFRGFRGEDEGWRVTEVGKAEVAAGLNFAVEHGRDFPGVFLVVHAERVASRDRLRQAKIEVFEQVRCGLSVLIEIGEHQGVEGVVDGGGNLCCDDAVSLGIDEKDPGGGLEDRQGFGDSYLFGAEGEPVFDLHLGPVAGEGLQPLDVVIDVIANGYAGREGIEEFFGETLGTLDAGVDVVPLLEVDVFEEIAAYGFGGDGAAEHVDSGKVWDGTFDGHEPVA